MKTKGKANENRANIKRESSEHQRKKKTRIELKSSGNQANIERTSNPCRGCPAPYYRCVAAAQHDRFPARWSRIDSKAQGSLGCDSPWRLLMVRIPRNRYFVCVFFSIFSIHAINIAASTCFKQPRLAILGVAGATPGNPRRGCGEAKQYEIK